MSTENNNLIAQCPNCSADCEFPHAALIGKNPVMCHACSEIFLPAITDETDPDLAQAVAADLAENGASAPLGGVDHNTHSDHAPSDGVDMLCTSCGQYAQISAAQQMAGFETICPHCQGTLAPVDAPTLDASQIDASANLANTGLQADPSIGSAGQPTAPDKGLPKKTAAKLPSPRAAAKQAAMMIPALAKTASKAEKKAHAALVKKTKKEAALQARKAIKEAATAAKLAKKQAKAEAKAQRAAMKLAKKGKKGSKPAVNAMTPSAATSASAAISPSDKAPKKPKGGSGKLGRVAAVLAILMLIPVIGLGIYVGSNSLMGKPSPLLSDLLDSMAPPPPSSIEATVIQRARFEARAARYELQPSDLGMTMLVEVDIANIGTGAGSPDYITIQLLDGNGASLLSWPMNTAAQDINQGQIATFIARIVEPPAGVSRVKVDVASE